MLKKKLFLIIFTSIFLVSCSQKNNIIDFDISDLPKPKNIQPAKDEIEELTQQDNKKFIKDLDIFQSRDKLLSKVNIGKNNPFSKGETELNKFSSNFKLTGFLNTETKQYGMIAQEVEELLPELVKDYGDNKKKQLNYTAIIPVLVESIKELSAKVTALEGS